jgi:hypothetical protein
MMLVGAQSWAETANPLPDLPDHLQVTPPVGWGHLPGLSERISKTTSQTAYFGEEQVQSGAHAYGRAKEGALYIIWVDTLKAHASPHEALRGAFDHLHESPFIAATKAGSTQEVRYREHKADHVAELNFEWAHMENDTVNISRAFGFQDSQGRLHLALAECVLHNETINTSRPQCEDALKSFQLSAKTDTVSLPDLGAPKEVAAPVFNPETEVPELKTGETLDAPSLGPPPKDMGRVLYEGPPPADKGDDNRLLILIGAVLLAIAVYLTTRSRDDESSGDTDDEEKPEVEHGEENAE